MSTRVEALIRDVKEERSVTARVIRGIYEVNRHKDYLAYNCDSLWQFCVIVLGYDSGAAYRRIEAAKLLNEAPQVAEKIERGELTLTNLATVSRIQEKARKSGKQIPTEQLLSAVAHTETRVAERKCVAIALKYGIDVDPEKRRYDDQVEDLLSALSHKHPGINREALLRLAIAEMHGKYCAEKEAGEAIKAKNPASAHVNAKLRAAVEKRGEYCCEWIEEDNGQRCGRRHQLEVDHILPRALGGQTELHNLRLLCRRHNQQAAREAGLRRPATSARKPASQFPPREVPHTLPNPELTATR